MPPKTSINILTYNGQKWLAKCLDSILNQSFKDFEFVIIDNGSTDGTPDFLQKYFKGKKQKHGLSFNEKNLGFAAGHNQAINKSKSEYILCLNQDIILEPDYLEKLVEFLENNKDAAAVSGKLLVWDDPSTRFARPGYTGKTNIIDSLGLELKKSWQVIDIGAGELSSQKDLNPQKLFGVSAASCIYRRTALEDVKFKNQYFDELFFSFKEDIDLSFRLNKKNWSSWLIPKAQGYHVRTAFYRGDVSLGFQTQASIAKNRQQRTNQVNYWSYRNHWYLLIKHMSWQTFKKNFAWIVPYEFKKLVYVVLFEWGSLRAFGDVVKNWKKLSRTSRE